MTICDILGVSDVLKSVQDKTDKVNAEIQKKLTSAAGELIARSTRLTPIETGELRARTFIDKPQLEDGAWLVNCGYEKNSMAYPKTGEGTGNEYAVYVHERMDLKHKVGQAKFLETAFKDFEDEMLEYLRPAAEEGFEEG